MDAGIQVSLPLLEILSKIFNRNPVKGRQGFSLNHCNVGKTPPFQILIHPWEHKKKKVAMRDIGGEGEGRGHNRHFVFSQKVGVLLTSQRFNENRWRPLAGFPLKILNNVSSSGSGAGIAASRHKGRTLKGTKVSYLYDYFKYFF